MIRHTTLAQTAFAVIVTLVLLSASSLTGCLPKVEQQGVQSGGSGEQPAQAAPNEVALPRAPVLAFENAEWKEEKLSYRFHFPPGSATETSEVEFFLENIKYEDRPACSIFWVSPADSGQTRIVLSPGNLRPLFYEKGVATPDGFLLFQTRYLKSYWEGHLLIDMLIQNEVSGPNTVGLYESEQLPLTMRHLDFENTGNFMVALNYSGLTGQVIAYEGGNAGEEEITVNGKSVRAWHVALTNQGDFWYSVEEPSQLLRWSISNESGQAVTMDLLGVADLTEEDRERMSRLREGFDPEEFFDEEDLEE